MKCYGRRHWRRWRLTHWLLQQSYGLGLIAGSSLDTHCHWDCPGHPSSWGWVAGDIWILRWHRPYVLGWPSWKWGCLIRRRHLPGQEIGFGRCGRCLPWECCGATTVAHAPDCQEAWE
jgi:hypothetical protein